MTNDEKVRSFALSRVGCPYLMGGTGQFCTVSYRQARAEQYPVYADKIKKNCPRMSGAAASCAGCRWFDGSAGTGKRAYDCAQLAKAAMAAAGISEVSGATSQWKKTAWAEKGTIDRMPTEKVCQVFRADSSTVMGHTGIYLGDGTVVHARGHDYGVVRQELNQGNTFTHYGIPKGLYDEKTAPPDEEPDAMDAEEYDTMQIYEVTGKSVALRIAPSTGATIKERIPTGRLLYGEQAGADWMKVQTDGKEGYMMAEYLRQVGAEQEAAQDEDGLTRRVATAALENLMKAAAAVTAALGKV